MNRERLCGHIRQRSHNCIVEGVSNYKILQISKITSALIFVFVDCLRQLVRFLAMTIKNKKCCPIPRIRNSNGMLFDFFFSFFFFFKKEMREKREMCVKFLFVLAVKFRRPYRYTHSLQLYLLLSSSESVRQTAETTRRERVQTGISN